MAVAIGVAVGLSWSAAETLAADAFPLCGPGFAIPVKPEFGGDVTREQIEITADEADLSEQGVSLLHGNVQYNSGDRRIVAESMSYDQPRQNVVASGNLQLWDDGLYLSGSSAELDLGADSAEFRDAVFMLADTHARGGAQRIVLSGSELVRVEDAHYTTCNPDDEDWRLEAAHIELDRVENVGTARDVKVLFFDTPIFYTPFMTFPLSDARKTGFLTPAFGIGGETGAEVTVPYYFNIAPNLDATVSARVMTRRGLMLGGEFRYLTEYGQGELSAELVPDDRRDDEARGQFVYRHRGSFWDGWATDIDYNTVSDREYFEDFGNSLSVSSTRHLNQRADVTYSADYWSLLGRVQNYQTVDRTIAAADRPYKRLPQVLFQYNSPNRNRTLRYGGYAEAVNFERRSSVTGLRMDIEPYVSYPMRTAGTFLIPTAKLRYTHYALDNAAPGISDGQDRLIPSFSLDGGVFLERDTNLFGTGYVQTLEPRVYYLYKGFDDQRNLPVFDTAANTFSFAQLFRDDRFSGGDRVGDAHQVSLALTTRLLDPASGDEVLRASVGQIRYLRDRRVTLPGDPVEVDDSSDLVGEISAQVARAWNLTAGVQWDPDDNRTDRSTVGVRYQPDPGTVVNASYRFVRDAVESTDFSFRWPIRHDLGVVGRWNYALADERTLEAFGGIEYDSCCWAVRAVARRHLSDTSGDYSNSVFLQLELKGLAGVGRDTERFLERSIPGFQNTF